MNPEDLVEALLAPCQPSQLAPRDESFERAGESASSIAAARDLVAAIGYAPRQSPTAALRARVMASATRRSRYGRFADRVARLFDIPIETAERLLSDLGDPSRFVPSGIPGVDVIPVEAPSFPGALTVLARIQPGVHFPLHAHVGDETMLILSGGLREVGGQEAWGGDELFRPDGSQHAFVALEGEPCFAATLVEGTIELR
jgi:hypothetical protein